MYYRQKCPRCGVVKEFVHVQVDHHINCKNCNYEFQLKATHWHWVKYSVIVLVLAVVGTGGFFAFRTLHNWWIYR